MPVPLRSANLGPAKSMQFTHFGVMDTGAQSKGSTVTSLVVNVVLAAVVVVISAAATRQTVENNRRIAQLIVPIMPEKVEPPKPRIVPPKPKLPQIAKVEPPKIHAPEVKAPDVPKPPTVKMDTPKVQMPAPPKQQIAMAAPRVVNLGHPEAASVPNNDPHPSAVRLGHPDSPIPNLHGPAVAPVNLARGMPGMNPGNTGNGPRAAEVHLGNGSPESSSIRGNSAVAVNGIPHGVPGGTGPLNSTGRVAGPVNLGQTQPGAAARPSPSVASAPQVKAPKVIYKPKPQYTAEAIQMHLEGVVSVRIRVLPTGAVQVLGIKNGLGHGLDESAERAVMATKFEPATDSSGHPIAWDGVVNVAFQLAG